MQSGGDEQLWLLCLVGVLGSSSSLACLFGGCLEPEGGNSTWVRMGVGDGVGFLVHCSSGAYSEWASSKRGHPGRVGERGGNRSV